MIAVEHVVVDVPQDGRLPVHAIARRIQRVEHLLRGRVRHRLDHVGHRWPELAQRPEQRFAFRGRAVVEGDDDDDRHAVGRGAEAGVGAGILGCALRELADTRAGPRGPSAAARSAGPPSTVGPTACRRYSNDVTTPKLPPPPRTAQNRSAFSSALAVRS